MAPLTELFGLTLSVCRLSKPELCRSPGQCISASGVIGLRKFVGVLLDG